MAACHRCRDERGDPVPCACLLCLYTQTLICKHTLHFSQGPYNALIITLIICSCKESASQSSDGSQVSSLFLKEIWLKFWRCIALEDIVFSQIDWIAFLKHCFPFIYWSTRSIQQELQRKQRRKTKVSHQFLSCCFLRLVRGETTNHWLQFFFPIKSKKWNSLGSSTLDVLPCYKEGPGFSVPDWV